MSSPTSTILSRAFAIVTVAAAAIALSGCSILGNIPTGSSGDAATEGTTTDVFTIKVGDCLNDAATTGTVSEVPTIDCSVPHDSEAYASVLIADGDFPGDDAIQAQAQTDCVAEYPAFIGIAYEDSALDFSYYFPTEQSWGQGDREILCVAYDPNGQITGSLKGAVK